MMNIKEKCFRVSIFRIFLLISLFSFGSFILLVVKGDLDLLNGILTIFIPVAWTGYATSVVILLWVIISHFILKKTYYFSEAWGARLLLLTAGAELAVWLVLLFKGRLVSGVWDLIALEELIFPIILSVSLIILSVAILKKKPKTSKVNIILLLVTIVIFILPREAGEISWNLTKGNSWTSTEVDSSNHISMTNWGKRSQLPADYNAQYSMVASGLSGPIGKILQNEMSSMDVTFSDDDAYVSVTGMIRDPSPTLLLPFVKWGTVTADIIVTVEYLISTFEFDSDNSNASSFSYSSYIDLHIESKRVLFGIAGVYDFNKQAAEEIYSIIEENVVKALGY